ncbi:hypothetical protein PQQ51_14805 [Paraburkholderia xenovorans]|uniref:hypothetical protein n=1 Tax=Paraburkholderia xenovorans TaxID=36873 RepID=UPI0038BD82B0
MSGRYLKKKNYPKKTGIDFFAENNKAEFGWITTRKLSRAIARKLPHAWRKRVRSHAETLNPAKIAEQKSEKMLKF